MAILKEFTCAAHGPFEEFVKQDETPSCPKGCSKRFVRREIRTAPATRGVVMGRMDGLQKDLAHDFGLSDLKVQRDTGTSVMQNLRSGTDFSPKWVDTPRPSAGWSQRGEKPAALPVSSFGMEAGNALAGANTPKSIPTKIMGSYKGED
jgi:hypothetical protein